MRPSENTFFNRLQALFNVLVGVDETPNLPRAFVERSTWELRRGELHIPSAWRRRPRER